MAGPDPQRAQMSSLIERRVQKIANARSVTVGLAVTFLLLAFVGAVVIWLLDRHDFTSFGSAVWWALQTVTTVGYGDVVPKAGIGRVIGGVEMVLGVSFVAFLTAGVTSTVIQRAAAQADETDRAARAHDTKTIVDSLAETRTVIRELEKRLAGIEARQGTPGP
jgi:voltage-gated potassium channel